MAVEKLMDFAPKINIGGIAPWIIGIIVFVGLLIAITIFCIYWFSFSQKIVLFRKVAGYVRVVGKDNARLVRVSKAGDYLMFTRKTKKWLPRPIIEISPKVWWYFVREDGEWINFAIDDLDEKMKKAGAFYIDSDMRMTRIANEKLLRERLQGQTFLEKYGATLMVLGTFVLIVIFLIIFLWKYNEIINTTQSVMTQADIILQRVQAMGVGGGGQLVPVNP